MNTDDGVPVIYNRNGDQERAVTGDYCICTIPPMVLARIPSNLSAGVQAALLEPTPVSTGKVGLDYGRRWWEEDLRILGGITNSNLNTGTIWYPSFGYLSDKGVVIGSYNFGANAELYAAMTPAQRVEEAVKQGSKIHGPVYRDELDSAFTVAWRRIRYNEGGWVSWASRSNGYALLNEPDGNVYFAGDHLSYEIAWQAGAIYSGRKAVTALSARAATASTSTATSTSRAV